MTQLTVPHARLDIWIPFDLSERLRHACYVTNRSKSALVRLAIQELIEKIQDGYLTQPDMQP